MRSVFAIAISGLVSVAAAQYTILPDSVALSTRELWCNSQTSSCPLICLQTIGNSNTPQDNTCDATDLSYSCVCSNGVSPNATEFSQTLPYFICTEWGNQCVNNCNGVSSCAAACRTDHPCGAQNPIRVNTSTISSTASVTRTTSLGAGATTNTAGQTVFSGFGGAAATSSAASGSGSTGAAAALEVGQAYGLAVVAAGLFGGFALLI